MIFFLIEPYDSVKSKKNMEEPLALEYAAASILEILGTDESSIKIFDMRLEKSFSLLLKGAVENQNEDLWVMCIMENEEELYLILKVFYQVKALFPNAISVLGCRSSFKKCEHSLRHPVVDVIAYSVPGAALANFVKNRKKAKNNKELELLNIKNISIFSGGKWLNFVGESIPSNNLPLRNLTLNYRKHYSYDGKPTAWIQDYHAWPYSFGSNREGLVKRKTEDIVEEIKGLDEKHIFFSQKNLSDAKWVKELVVGLKNAGISKKYYAEISPPLVIANPHLFSLWKSIGLTEVSLRTNKGIYLKKYEKAVSLLDGIGLRHVAVTNQKLT